jgi:hypothetical protein
MIPFFQARHRLVKKTGDWSCIAGTVTSNQISALQIWYWECLSNAARSYLPMSARYLAAGTSNTIAKSVQSQCKVSAKSTIAASLAWVSCWLSLEDRWPGPSNDCHHQAAVNYRPRIISPKRRLWCMAMLGGTYDLKQAIQPRTPNKYPWRWSVGSR